MDLNAVQPAVPLLILIALALALRLSIHIGRTPSGVDTWFFLLYVRELRCRKRFPVKLPQYLLQEAEQTYPPLFPLFLALFPVGFLERFFWLISPIIDVVQLALLYMATYKISGSVNIAALAGLIYAVTPQLIAENRNLNSRSFAALLNAGTMLLLFRATVVPHFEPVWFVSALLLAGALLLAHHMTTQALIFTSFVLAIVFRDPRYFIFLLMAFAIAQMVSLGFYRRVLRQHWDVVDFWRRNLRFLGAHQILDSPIYGCGRRQTSSYYQDGLQGVAKLCLRLLGENPFILAMLVTPIPGGGWPALMYWWAVSVLACALATTFVPPLRIFGQGHLYMKLSAFPAAYTLGLAMADYNHPTMLAKLTTLSSLLLSAIAVSYLYRYHRGKATEHTSEAPSELQAVAEFVRVQPAGDLLCLPAMYADYLAYHCDKKVYWGAHNAGFRLIEPFFPVFRKPIAELVAQSETVILIIHTEYTTVEALRIQDRVHELTRFGGFHVYELAPTASARHSSSLLASQSY